MLPCAFAKCTEGHEGWPSFANMAAGPGLICVADSRFLATGESNEEQLFRNLRVWLLQHISMRLVTLKD